MTLVAWVSLDYPRFPTWKPWVDVPAGTGVDRMLAARGVARAASPGRMLVRGSRLTVRAVRAGTTPLTLGRFAFGFLDAARDAAVRGQPAPSLVPDP